MSDNYHYEEGAIHNDHKKVLHIENLQGADLKKLVRVFLKDSEDADFEEVENVNASCNENDNTAGINKEILGHAIKEVEKLMWAQSAYAIIFCAARDIFDYTDNATLFENDISSVASRLGLNYPCPPNTISSAIYNNPYLKLHVSKWEKPGVKSRSILLANAFVKAVKDLQNK
jgi:hypothetical protein